VKPTPFSVRFRRLCLGMAVIATSALAQSNAADSQSAHAAAPQDRVRGSVIAEQRTALKGQTRRMDPAAVDLGEVSPSLSTGRMMLLLRRSDEQQAHLGQFLSKVQDPKSAGYRHWMTPAGYGAAYGVSDHDLAAVQQWLQANGLKVEKVAAARNAILFSGTAGGLANAFHTSIHSYRAGQQLHFGNATDPEVPTALAPVIAGVSPMNDFRPRPLHVLREPARFDAASHHLRPALTGGSDGLNSLYVTPADASIIYDTPNQNFNPAAKQTLDGTGVTIGIVGYSALAMADVQNYRTAFLPAGAASNLPTQILDGAIDPGIIEGGVASEGLLDVEVTGGLAPGAAINYYYAASTDLSDGLILAGLRALEDNNINILSVSYGECEADLGIGGNLEWSELWQQAAAQGISVTVSTGDSGSASCDTDSQSTVAAVRGLSVSGLSSTPYNIAVGGTDYYSLADNFSQYVNTDSGSYPYYGTALSYIPENPWNDSSTVVGNSFTQNLPTYDGVGDTNIIAGGGGLSTLATCQGYFLADGSCSQSLSGYPQPPYQTGFQQQTPVRSVPDVSLLAANGFFGASWVFCSDSTVDAQGGVYTDCQTDAKGQLVAGTRVGLIGGTSAAAPAFAGMLAMISQSQGGARLGQADAVLYNLAQDYNPSLGDPGKYQRAFHDIAIGNNSVYCASGSPNCDSNNFLEGYNATPSYDMASGLGSVDLSQLINLWTATNFTSTSNTLSAGTSTDAMSSAAISVVHGTPLNFTTLVTPADATGQFSIVSTSSTNAASFSDYGSLDGTGTGYLTTNDLPGGTYTVYAYYAGDTSHTGSQSSNGINVTISPESSTTTLSFGTYDPITFAINEGVSTVGYGMNTYANAQPFGNNSTVYYTGTLQPDGLATGNVTFTSSDGKTQSAAINSVGIAQLPIGSLAPGTYTYQASYAGDASFGPSSSTSQTLTVTKGSTSLQLQSSASAVSPTGQLTLQALLQTDSVAQFPSGNVSAQANGHVYAPAFSSQGYSNGAAADLFTFTIPASDLVAGSNLVAVNYGGDSNYLAATGSLSVTLAGVAGTFTLTGPDQSLMLEASQQGSTTISVASLNGFTGQVNMSCAVSSAPSGHTPTCQATAATVYGSFGASSVLSVATYSDTPAGNYTITVTGVSGQLTQSVKIPLQATAGPGFALSAADSWISLSSPGQSTGEKLSIQPIQGFTGTVTLACIVAPTPGSGKAPTCTIPGSIALAADAASITLQIASDATAIPGSYTIAVTAVSGGVQQTLALPLVLNEAAASANFDLSAATGSVSIASAGESVTDLLTIRPAGGFTGSVQLSCTVTGGSSSTSAPACTVPTTVSMTTSSVVTATLTVNTVAPSTTTAKNAGLFGKGISGIALGCVLIFVAPKRRKIWTTLGLLILMAGALGVTACGGSGHSTSAPGAPGTPAGSYTVTVTALSGSIKATTQINVTVQ
jgi:trimeric autotransporter adhesin